MATLTEMRTSLAKLRKLLNSRKFSFEVSEGSSRQLTRDNPLYVKVLPYRENRIIIAPSMLCICKSTDRRFYVGVSNDWGELKVTFEDHTTFEEISVEKTAERIEEYLWTLKEQA